MEPVIEPGWAGGSQVETANVLGLLEPQLLFAVTEISPPCASATTVMEVVVDEPLQPDGIVQEYDVAPETAPMLYV